MRTVKSSYTGSQVQRWRAGPLDLVQSGYEPGHSTREHAHGFAYWCLMLEGKLHERLADGGERTLHPGTLVYHPAGESHAHRAGDHGVHCFHIRPGSTLPLMDARDPRFEWGPGPEVELARRIHDRTRAADCSRAEDLALVALTLQLYGRLAQAGGSRDGCHDDAPPPWLEAARAFVLSRVPESTPLELVAERADVSVAHLCRSWKRYFGTTVGQTIRDARLQRASRLLRDHDRTISEVAFATGFADHSHLTRSFRDRFGCTPSDWRGSHP